MSKQGKDNSGVPAYNTGPNAIPKTAPAYGSDVVEESNRFNDPNYWNQP
jgi:hypothetical protein